ncbi:MAG: response regulator transcription factor [Balneolaceae bacterium]
MDIKIGIVEDQRKIRERLIARLAFYDDITLTLEAETTDSAILKLSTLEKSELPDVILMDIEMPGKSGIEATAIIKSLYPQIDILIQTVFEDENKIFQSVLAGASGYLLKDEPIQKYVEAIQQLVEGGAALSPLVASKLMNIVVAKNSVKKNSAKEIQSELNLTDREVEILNGVVEDLTERQIGEKLFISHHTVRTHIKNIYKKLHVNTRASAVRLAITKGLFD